MTSTTALTEKTKATQTPNIGGRSTGWRANILGSVALLAGVIAAFWRVGYCQLCTYDDPLYITTNVDLKQGLSWGGLKWAFFGVNTCNWHPLTTLSNLAEYQFFKYNPAVYHIDNLIFHAIATVLLFLVLTQMTGKTGRSFVVAALFGWHPLHVQSVAWASERKDVLSAVFCMLTLWAYTAYVRHPGKWRYSPRMLFLFACGLMSKPMLVTLPPALLLLDLWPLGRMKVGQWITPRPTAVPLRRLILEKVPMLAMALVCSVITFRIQQSYGATATLVRVPLDFRVANAAYAYLGYLGKMIWPSALAVFYPLNGDLAMWQGCVALLVMISGLVLWLGWRWPYVVVGWFWYVGTLIPVIGLVQVGDQAMADRYTYIPLIGPFIIIVWAVSDAFKRFKRGPAVLAGVSAVVLLALGVRTWIEVGYWKDTPALFTRATVVVPRNARAYLALGSWALKTNDLDGALENLRLSVRYDPDFPEAQNRYGVALVAHNRHDEAGVAFAKAISTLEAESSEKELKRDKVYPEAEYNLALICLRQGDYNDAIAHFQRRLWVTPDEKKSYAGMAEAYCKQDKLDDAAEAAAKSLAIDPDYPPAHYNLGLTRIRQGNLAAAASEFKQVIRAAPEDPDSRYQLAEVLARLGKRDEAIGQLRDLIKYNRQEARAYLKLGALLQAKGEVEQAINQYQRAVAIDPNSAAANNLAWVLATSPNAKLRDGKQAVALAEKYSQNFGKDHPEVLDTLAAAYAEVGDFAKAVAVADSGIATATQKGNARLAAEIAHHVESYRKNQAYRDMPTP